MSDNGALFRQFSETCHAAQRQLEGLHLRHPILVDQAKADLGILVDFALAACLDNDEEELKRLLSDATCLLDRCSSLPAEVDLFDPVAA